MGDHLLGEFLDSVQSHPDVARDGDGGFRLSLADFNLLLANEEAVRSLTELGVDVEAMHSVSEFLFTDTPEMSREQLLDKVLQFRGSNTATVKDIVDLRQY